MNKTIILVITMSIVAGTSIAMEKERRTEETSAKQLPHAPQPSGDSEQDIDKMEKAVRALEALSLVEYDRHGSKATTVADIDFIL